MDGTQPNIARLATYVKLNRFKEHDDLEERVMDAIRKSGITTRNHMPDRWVSFSGRICPFDVKSCVFCEDNSHNEYKRLFDAGFGMWIVYKDEDVLKAGWFDELGWKGPIPPSSKSRSGDPYYIISGGKDFFEWLKTAPINAKRFRAE